VQPGKARVTIRLDDDILNWFRQQVDDAGGGNYQTLINEALRTFVSQRRESLETTLRRVIRYEIRRAGWFARLGTPAGVSLPREVKQIPVDALVIMKSGCHKQPARTTRFAGDGWRRGAARVRNWNAYAALRSNPSTRERRSGRSSGVTAPPFRRRHRPRG